MRRATSLCLISMLSACGAVESDDVVGPDVGYATDEGELILDPSAVDQEYVGDAFHVVALVPQETYDRAWESDWVDYNVTTTIDYMSGGLPVSAEYLARLSQLVDLGEEAGLATVRMLVAGPPPDGGGIGLVPTVSVVQRFPKPPSRADRIRLFGSVYDEESGNILTIFEMPKRIRFRQRIGLGDVEINATVTFQTGGVTTELTSGPLRLSEIPGGGVPFIPIWFATVAQPSPVPDDDLLWIITSFTAKPVR